MELTDELKQKYPDGMKLVTDNLDADKLHTLLLYPAERVLEVEPAEQRRWLYSPDTLDTDIRLKPKDYQLLEQEGGQSLTIYLADTFKLMDNLYIEDIPCSYAARVLLAHPDMPTIKLKETLQLFNLMENGVEVIETGKRLNGRVQEHIDKVVKELQNIYTGVNKPLWLHPYYQEDVRYVLDHELKEMAEVKLRERQIIQTKPQVFETKWANPKGDDWACNEMAKLINRDFQDYRGKLAEAIPIGSDMQLIIYTTKPRWRQEILETVSRSWALVEMREITDIRKMPQDIASWREQENKEKVLHTETAGIKNAMYFHETGTDALVVVNHERKMKCYGERLSPDNHRYIDNLVTKENMRTMDGTLFFTGIGPKLTFLENQLGSRTETVQQETVDGKPVLVEPFTLRPSVVERYPDHFTNITGRVTQPQVIGQEYSSAIRCCIDGEQQNATRLSYQDWQKYKNGTQSAEQLAIHYFTWELMHTTQEQEQAKGLKR